MEDTTDFLQVLEGLQSSSNTRRDPRSIRLAAVVSAMVDVVGQDEISPAKIYASTLTALEGTLEQESRSGAVSDTLATQNALLELVSVTAPYMSPAGLGATLPVSSRVLQGVVTFAHALDTSSSRALETLDELGGINAVLRGVCRAATQILLHVPTSTTEVTVRPLFVGTLLALVEDRRPKVRKAAMNGTCEILVAGSCHAAIRKTVSSYAHSSLSKAKKHQKNHADLHYAPDLLHLLGFLEQGILYLDNRKLQADLMELLMMILQADTSDTSGDYVANFSRKDSTSKLLVVNGILSVILTTLEDESETREEYLNAFSERVAASLLQARPMTVVIGQQCDTDIVNNARTLYGRALISSCTRVLESNLQVGCKLLPLAVQMVIQLSRPCEDGASDVQVSQTLMVELTRLFRLRLMPLMDMHVKLLELDRCMHQCLLGMEPLLQNVFRPTWSVTLQAFAFFLHLIRDKHGDVSRMVQALIELRSNVDFDLMARQAIGDAIGSLIQGVGLESFWGWVTWSSASASRTKKHEESSRSAVISLDRAWLLPLMKTSATAVTPQRPHLEFFQSTVLEMARRCDAYSAAANVKKADAKAHRARVLDLWELFPCFCQSPVDVDAAFPSLAQILMRAMGDSRYPELVTIICSGLTTLARDVSDRIPDNGTGEQDAEVVSSVSTSILPVLFKLVETLQGTRNSGKTSSQANEDVMALEEVPTSQAAQSKTIQDSQRAQIVCETIAELSRLSPRAFVQSLFKKVMQRLLAATQSEYDQSETICTLLGLSQALVHSEALDDSSVSLLYRAVKPFIRTDEYEARVQKKAYKVMFEICEKHSEFTSETERLKELTELLTGSIMTCQVSARHMRLKCMSIIVDGLDCSNKQHLDIIPKIVPEVLLCLKDSNGKTREAAYQLILSMANLQSDKTEFFDVIMAALGAQTPHMRSAAVMALSRLVFEYARTDETVYSLLPSLLQTVIILFDEDSREVVKSVIAFVRVSVAALSPEQLEPLLPEVVGGLLKYHKGKDRFRTKIKIILKKLVRHYGYDKLMPLVPETDTRLLTHMRKLSERAARRKAAQREDGHARPVDFDELMESDEEDSDDGRTFMTGATGFTRMTATAGKSVRSAAIDKSQRRSIAASIMASSRSRKSEGGPRLRAEGEGEVMDMLSPKMAKSVHFSDDDSDDSDMDDGMMEFDAVGRLVIHDDREEASREGLKDEEDLDNADESYVSGKKRRLSKFESAKVARDEAQKNKSRKQQVKALGAAYKAKKAGGDVKKKGQKFEPYAYVPLDGKSYSKKNRRATVEQMSTVVRRGGKRKR